MDPDLLQYLLKIRKYHHPAFFSSIPAASFLILILFHLMFCFTLFLSIFFSQRGHLKIEGTAFLEFVDQFYSTKGHLI